jgi:uncharacterized membrane protein (UPF0182 family)
VKVVVDAYNGTVDFYLTDSADPIAATYQRIFPGLFKPFAAMPAGLQKHIRYPEDLFLIQARIYQAYHMAAADVFYNREDLWQFPRQPGGGGTAMMAPYYIIMRLPGEPQAEFFLMIPMVHASYGEHVVMKETLAEALSALFEAGTALAAPSATTGRPPAGPAADRAREALHHYNQAIERLKSGDWAGFGTELDAMRGLLEDMSQQSGGR